AARAHCPIFQPNQGRKNWYLRPTQCRLECDEGILCTICLKRLFIATNHKYDEKINEIYRKDKGHLANGLIWRTNTSISNLNILLQSFFCNNNQKHGENYVGYTRK